MSDKTVIQSHRMTVEAVVCADGSAALLGITAATLPAGIEIVGNGTLPHPLGVKVAPQINDAAKLYAFVQSLIDDFDSLLENGADVDGGDAVEYLDRIVGDAKKVLEGVQAKETPIGADAIYEAFVAAIQPAEEIGGTKDAGEYIDLMDRIILETHRRRANCAVANDLSIAMPTALAARIAVVLEGGIVQDVIVEGVPPDTPCVVIDYDTDGADREDVAYVEQTDGRSMSRCVPRDWTVTIDDCQRFYDALASKGIAAANVAAALPDDSTIEICNSVGAVRETTWAEFCAANSDGLGAELLALHDALLDGESYTIGGGAAPVFSVRVSAGRQFRNFYRHCGTEWTDVWSCACNDQCPICKIKDIEPYKSEEIA